MLSKSEIFQNQQQNKIIQNEKIERKQDSQNDAYFLCLVMTDHPSTGDASYLFQKIALPLNHTIHRTQSITQVLLWAWDHALLKS